MKTYKNTRQGHSPPTAGKRRGASGGAPASRGASPSQKKRRPNTPVRQPQGGRQTPNGRIAVNPAEDREAARREHARKRRQRIRRRKLIVYSAFFLLVAGVAVTLSLTLLFHIEKIEVRGNSRYDSQSIINTTEIKIDDNLFVSNTGKAEKAILEAFPYIKAVKVDWAFPPGIVINVTETHAAFVIEHDAKLSLLDPDGRVLETDISAAPAGLPVIRGAQIGDIVLGQPVVFTDPSAAANIPKIMAAVTSCDIRRSKYVSESTPLSERGNIEIIDMTDTISVSLIFDGRLTLELGTPTDLEYKLRFAKGAIDKLADNARGTLDLSVLKKATFSPERAETELTTAPEDDDAEPEEDEPQQ